MSPGRKATLPGSCPQWSIDRRKLLRIGVTKRCALTEIPTALLVTAERSLDRFGAGCLIRDVFIFRHTVKSRFLEKYFCVPSFRADKRARIIIDGYLAVFRKSVEPYLYIIGEANFDQHL